MSESLPLVAALGLPVTAALVATALIRLTFPLMERYALARPNARSSHKVPTAQGGGAAVIVATIAVMWVGYSLSGGAIALSAAQLATASLAAAVLATAGALDDIRPLPVLPRLGLQFGCAILLVLSLPTEARILPFLPGALERLLLVVGLVWFVNLTNFMDGIDWITVAEMIPVTSGLILLAWMGALPEGGALAALALLGALIGFAPYNRHVARLFLGDVGSLPIGALVGWLLLLLAGAGYPAAALLLPMYYLADATVTLFRRLLRGERLSEAHRSHFYQLACQRGFAVPAVTRHIAVLNVFLVALAILSAAARNPWLDGLLLAVGALSTATLLVIFERGQR